MSPSWYFPFHLEAFLLHCRTLRLIENKFERKFIARFNSFPSFYIFNLGLIFFLLFFYDVSSKVWRRRTVKWRVLLIILVILILNSYIWWSLSLSALLFSVSTVSIQLCAFHFVVETGKRKHNKFKKSIVFHNSTQLFSRSLAMHV